MGDLLKRNCPRHQISHPVERRLPKSCPLSRLTKPQWRSGVSTMWLIAALAIYTTCCNAQDETSALCRSTGNSCNECMQRNPHCSWCADPAFPGDFRCDAAQSFNHSCPPQYQYQDLSHFRVTENVAAGTYEPKYGKIRQLEPQQVHVLIKPGDTVTFPIKYYHANPEEKDIYVLNSDSHGVTLSYSMNCKGSFEHSQLCRKVQNAETVLYNVSVSIHDCKSHAVISIGIAALREVVALYIRPQCGCDCETPERQEKRSNHCSGRGTFSCGVCHCDDPQRGGRRCECDLPSGMSSSDLEGQCKEAPGKPMCSGRGYCACGLCVCDPAQLYSGRHCECANVACPLINDVQCNGQGNCVCGKCQCHSGWSGSGCDCSPQTDRCLVHDGSLCFGRGMCACNQCTCEDGYEGDQCERSAHDSVAVPPPETTTEPEQPTTTNVEEATSTQYETTTDAAQTTEGDLVDDTIPPAEPAESPQPEQALEPTPAAAVRLFFPKWILVLTAVITIAPGYKQV